MIEQLPIVEPVVSGTADELGEAKHEEKKYHRGPVTSTGQVSSENSTGNSTFSVTFLYHLRPLAVILQHIRGLWCPSSSCCDLTSYLRPSPNHRCLNYSVHCHFKLITMLWDKSLVIVAEDDVKERVVSNTYFCMFTNSKKCIKV